MGGMRAALIYAGLGAAIVVPVALIAISPQLAWRDPVYISAGIAGAVALALVLVQPVLAAGALPGLTARRGRFIHRISGAALVAAVVWHVAGLWLTSPPDVLDALALASPTPFSIWGVIAMWAVFATAILAALRRSLGAMRWRRLHIGLGWIIAAGSIVHVVLIEGTMQPLSKVALCVLIAAAMIWASAKARPFRP